MPVHKGRDRRVASNYRPISLTSVPSKRFERFLPRHITNHVVADSFLFDRQHGCRNELSCDTQLVEFTHDFYSALNQTYHTDAILKNLFKRLSLRPTSLFSGYTFVTVYRSTIPSMESVIFSHLVCSSLHVTTHSCQSILQGSFLHFCS